MNTDRFVIGDDTWARISGQVPGKASDRGVTGAAFPVVNGKYKSRFHSLSFNVSWDF